MSNQKGFSKIVLIIAVIVLIGMGYFVYNNSKKDKDVSLSDQTNASQSSVKIEEKQILTAEEMPEELTYEENLKLQGWKTYRNEEYGFEVDIPSNWEHLTGFQERIYESKEQRFSSFTIATTSYSSKGPIKITVPTFSIATTSDSIRKVIFNKIGGTYTDFVFGKTPELMEMSQISLDNEKGIKISFNVFDNFNDFFAVKHNNITFIGEFERYVGRFEREKIISTFKFVK